ncbi:MAG: glycosyltransferase family 4 protein [Acidobacteria bacterium]|nr:glycosyltransferase family 4 protein [Acidobacteriota bacterium]
MGVKLRVAINAQIRPGGGAGGIETVLYALAALGRLDDGPEEYVFVGPHDEPDWLRTSLDGTRRCVVVRGPSKPPRVKPAPAPLEPLKRALGPLRPAAYELKQRVLSRLRGAADGVPASDGFYEGLECDVIHFPFQDFVRCALPSVYNPHDLQHLHFPQFFTRDEIRRRESVYPAACRAAHTVVAASRFVKEDVVSRYRIPAAKVQVIPWAPPPADASTDEPGAAARALRERYGLDGGTFALYPAMTWEHKNHLRLLEALALLRDRDGVRVSLVCTGHQNDFWPRIERGLDELGLREQVKFLGVVPRAELSALYRAARFVILPTLFEAASAPLFEAWQHGAAVACSSVTSLPEQARDAALFFDPLSVESVAGAAARMAADAGLREDLRRRGRERLRDFSLERTAKAYRAVYRRAAGRALGEEDRWLLSWDWTREAAAFAPAR